MEIGRRAEDNVIEHVREGMARLRLTQTALAEATRRAEARGGGKAISQRALSVLLQEPTSRTDKRRLSIDQLVALAEVLQEPIPDLLSPPAAVRHREGWEAFLAAIEQRVLMDQAESRYEDLIFRVRHRLDGAPSLADEIREYARPIRGAVMRQLWEVHAEELTTLGPGESAGQLEKWLRDAPALAAAEDALSPVDQEADSVRYILANPQMFPSLAIRWASQQLLQEKEGGSE